MSTIEPKEGWAYVGCPHCGHVTTVPLDRLEPPPWCVHNGGTVVWTDPDVYTQASVRAWTRTVRVHVSEDT